jgi:hypothetical protein
MVVDHVFYRGPFHGFLSTLAFFHMAGKSSFLTEDSFYFYFYHFAACAAAFARHRGKTGTLHLLQVNRCCRANQLESSAVTKSFNGVVATNISTNELWLYALVSTHR